MLAQLAEVPVARVDKREQQRLEMISDDRDILKPRPAASIVELRGSFQVGVTQRGSSNR